MLIELFAFGLQKNLDRHVATLLAKMREDFYCECNEVI
jgi:hypothetical protein